MDKIDNFEKYQDNYSFKNKLHRLVWNACHLFLVRPFALPYFAGWRNFIFRCWGAKIGKGSVIHANAKIWAPWNLEVGLRTCIGPKSIVYNPGRIVLGNKVAISQYAYLCTASHNYESIKHTLYYKPIVIKDRAWIAARAFVGMGVTIGEGAVVGACAAVFKDVEPWVVVGGNPAKEIKKRVIKDK